MTQAELEIGLGTIEPENKTLEPKPVSIVSVQIEAVSTKSGQTKKAVFEVKHPDKEETIKISKIAYLLDGKVQTVGTWLNLDAEQKIQKGSGLYRLLSKIQANTLQESLGKSVDTVEDNSYLIFKVY